MTESKIQMLRNTVAAGLARGWLRYPKPDGAEVDPVVAVMRSDMNSRVAERLARLRRDDGQGSIARYLEQQKPATSQRRRRAMPPGGGGEGSK